LTISKHKLISTINTNKQDKVTGVTDTEISYLANVTSDIQAQLDAAGENITGAATSIITNNLNPNEIVISDINGKITNSNINSSYLDNLSSNIQKQFDDINKENITYYNPIIYPLDENIIVTYNNGVNNGSAPIYSSVNSSITLNGDSLLAINKTLYNNYINLTQEWTLIYKINCNNTGDNRLLININNDETLFNDNNRSIYNTDLTDYLLEWNAGTSSFNIKLNNSIQETKTITQSIQNNNIFNSTDIFIKFIKIIVEIYQ
jgi:hypothetical protein